MTVRSFLLIWRGNAAIEEGSALWEDIEALAEEYDLDALVEDLRAIVDIQDVELGILRRSRDVPWTFAWVLGTGALLVGLLIGLSG